LFFADVAHVLRRRGSKEIVFADDLNAFKVFDRDVTDRRIFNDLKRAQDELHRWGSANQISFDAGKESFHILSRLYKHRGPAGGNFRLLGIDFDCKLLMGDAVTECVGQCGWELQSILRTRRFYTLAELVGLYKAHVLSFIEYRTPALAHASATTLAPLDAIQARFLREVGLSEEEALLHFHLAPLHTRRHIAMLGVIHRAALGQGPPQLKRLFPIRDQSRSPAACHRLQVHDVSNEYTQEYVRRSAFGFVQIYNELMPELVAAPEVKTFQRGLQRVLCDRAAGGMVCWQNIFSNVV
jgi:hypothetical protein